MVRDVAHEVVVNVFAAMALTGLAFVAFGGRLEDPYLRLRGRAPVTGDVALLTIDEEAFYLWNPADPSPAATPRAMVARLVDLLRLSGARVVAVDLLLDQPAEGDDALASSLTAYGRAVIAERFIPPGTFMPGTVAPLAASAVTGFANLGQEERTLFSDELAVRSALLVTDASRATLSGTWPMNGVNASQADHVVAPAFALAAAWRFKHPDARTTDLGTTLATGCGGVPVRCTLAASALALPALPVALHDPLPINFRGPDGADGLTTIPASRALRLLGASAIASSFGADLPVEIPDDMKKAFADKLVVIGRVDGAADDRFVTPYSWPTMQSADMSGVRVQAQLIDVLLSGRHLRGPGAIATWGLAALLTLVAWPLRRRVFWPVALPVVGFATFVWTDGYILDVAPALGCVIVFLTCVHLYGRAASES